MNFLFNPANLILAVVGIAVVGLKIWALVDACTRSKESFEVHGKLTKIAWIAILALSLILGGGNVLGIFGIAAIIATVVYLVDVRPAVSGQRQL